MDASAAPPVSAPRVTKPKRQNRSRGWLRSRDREQLRLQNLQLDVNDLRQQIESLRVMRSLLHARALNARDAPDGSYIRRIREYYDIVHSGYRDVLWPRDGGGPISGREYLASIMDERMRMGRLNGLDQFISMWKRYTHCFDGLQFKMVGATVVPPDPQACDEDPPSDVVVVAESHFECSIGPQGIPLVFPHVSSRPELRQQLLASHLRGSGRFTITFDSRSHQVVRFDMSLDIVGALLGALQDPALVADVLTGARITPDCCIGDLSEYESPHPGRYSTPISVKGVSDRIHDDSNQRSEPRVRRQMKMEGLLSPDSVDASV